MTASSPLVSVVIIGRNEGGRLDRCLESVGSMDFPRDLFDVIYVDSNSTDDSSARAEAVGARVIAVPSSRPTAAMARNQGWRASSAAFILFLDGDTILDPQFLGRALEEFSNPRVAVAFGRRREMHPERSVYNLVLDLEWGAPAGPASYCGGDALMRRNVLEKLKGYDERLIAGEEPEMCRRLRDAGFQILSLDIPMTLHDLAIDRWGQYWKRTVRTGHAYAEVANRFWNSSDPLWKKEVQRNVIQGSLYLGLIAAAAVAVDVFKSVTPVVVLSGAFVALVVRTATKSRAKASSFRTRLLYGLHSHVQHVPILFGQIGYWRQRWSGERTGLIEYK